MERKKLLTLYTTEPGEKEEGPGAESPGPLSPVKAWTEGKCETAGTAYLLLASTAL